MYTQRFEGKLEIANFAGHLTHIAFRTLVMALVDSSYCLTTVQFAFNFTSSFGTFVLEVGAIENVSDLDGLFAVRTSGRDVATHFFMCNVITLLVNIATFAAAGTKVIYRETTTVWN